ncbi:L-lactate dehydrogenase [uncultured Phascolarctobacterium sp.]|uniref:L-lactate dehydrogenase n=1 Tax=Phascolarctobacterium sp. TaxID=2049039 RepID=UPI0025D53330|nr:L-lactate dehydrogenase [uncultured Phascolarctobacterium sp.]
MSSKTRKVGIIGLGHVGAHCAYSLAIQGYVDELVLVDVNEKKVISECQDLRDAVMYMPHHVKVEIASYEDLGDCDIIVNAAGNIGLLTSLDRNAEMNFTVAQVKKYIGKVMQSGFQGIIINITNPCDVVTDVIAKMSGLPQGRVFGTGTGLDTSRLLAQLSLQTGIDHQSISAYMIGEHGKSQITAWSCVNFGGVPLATLAQQDERFRFDKEEIQEKAIGGGWITYVGKGCTEYGICSTLARFVRAVFHDEKRIMPASAMLTGEYGEQGIFVGVPCIIGKDGVEKVIELPLNAEEKAAFHTCCDDIRINMKKAENIN